MKKRPDHLALWITLSVALLLIVLAIAGIMMMPLDIAKLDRLNQSSTVYDRNGSRIAVITGPERRTNIALVNVPRDVQNAFLAAEDARFYDHFGIDPYRMGGALVANLRRGSYAQGASTITQQLVKLTHLTSDKTMARKITEIFMALRLERILTKDQILERYLNTVYFGAGAYGIQSASRTYFGIDADQLTLSQGALLAAIIKSPSSYAPHINEGKAKDRRDLILSDMADYLFITEERAKAATDEPIAIRSLSGAEVAHPWAVDQATTEAAKALNITADELITGGYEIYTTLDPAAQAAAEQLFTDAANFPANAKDGTPVQAALVAVDTAEGGILALVGGREYAVQRGLNRATGMRRQPGSTLKPVSVYAAAIDQHQYLPISTVEDAQRDFGGGYSPRNVGDTYRGTVTLREALARSLNAASVDLITRVGIPSARSYAEAAGIAMTGSDNNLSLALGSMTNGASPAQMAAAYAPLSNGGQSVSAHIVRQIVDANGQIVYQYQAQSRRVMSAESAYMITSMLQSAVSWGSARKLGTVIGDVAAKTGTVAMQGGGNRDIWTVAYTPRASLAVWMGYDEPSKEHTLPDSASGSNQPAALCAKFLSDTKATTVSGRFALPKGLTEVLIDQRAFELTQRPMLATQLTPKSLTMLEVFRRGSEPTEPSTAWVAPTRVFDLRGELTALTTASLSFTALQQDAVYRVYRLEADPVLIAERVGAVGSTIAVVDDQSYEGAAYYVIPFHQELLREGIILEGKPSEIVTPKKPAGFLDWIVTPEPAATEEPVEEPVEEPLFGEDTGEQGDGRGD